MSSSREPALPRPLPNLSQFTSGGPLAIVSAPDGPVAFGPLSSRRYKASPDDWAIEYWLRACASKSPNTLRTYRKEVTRWRAFLAVLHGDLDRQDHLASATYEDVARFIAWIEFPGDWPLPPEAAARFRMSAVQAAKPKASPTVLRQALIILHGFYEELSAAIVPGSKPAASACELNPFKPYRKRVSKNHEAAFESKPAAAGADDLEDDSPDATGVKKAFTDEAWEAVWAQACEIPSEATKAGLVAAARQRLVIAVLRATWERRSAAAGIRWRDLRRARNGIWKIRRKRKGQREQWAPVPSALIGEIERYRSAIGLPISPQKDEDARSLYWMGGRSAGHDGPIADKTLYRVVKNTFQQAARRCVEEGRDSLAAELLRLGAGPHTIRHTMATQYLEDGGDVRHAQEALAHSSVVVTSRVYDTRHDTVQAEELQKQWQRSARKDQRSGVR